MSGPPESPRREGFEQQLVNAPESAVRHDQHLIARPRFLENSNDELVQVVLHPHARAKRSERRIRVPAQIRAEAEHAVGALETRG